MRGIAISNTRSCAGAVVGCAWLLLALSLQLALPWPCAAAAASTGQIAPELQGQLQTALDAARESCGAPGAVVCLALPGVDAVYAASGVADLATGRPVVADDFFAIGSLTKMFVAVTILQLAAEGKLDLDDPLAKYLPAFPQANAITVRMLLQHRSGIGDPTRVFFSDNTGGAGRQMLMSAWLILALGQQWTPEQLTALIANAAFDAAPGEKGAYSNSNYVLLGRVIQVVTGHKVSQEIRARILDPLGMAHTVFAGEEPLPETDMRCYALREGRYIDCRSLENASFAWTAGAMVSTAPDLLRFAQALFGGKLVPQPWLSQMLTFMPVAEVGAYGMGATQHGSGADEAWGHTGRTVAFSTSLWYYPASGRIEIALANLQRCNLSGITRQLGVQH
jgi:D-alanyl-D-alanine carboxypeptidase